MADEGSSVPCTCPSTGGDGLDLFDLDPSRRIDVLSKVTERGWYSLDMALQEPKSPITLVPRVGHALVTLPDKEEMYMMGGGNHEGPLTEIWRIDYSGSDPWLFGIEPSLSLEFPGRYEFFCALNRSRDRIWVFGGADALSSHNDVFYVDVDKGQICEVKSGAGVNDPESEVKGQESYVPSSRTQGSNSCIVDLKGQEHLIIFGGGVGKEKSVADGHLYKFDTVNSTWTRVEVAGSLPVAVQGHAMCAIGSKVYMFGGMESMRLFDDFFVIDLDAADVKWNKIRVSGDRPAPRAALGMTTVGKDIYIFGGVGEHGSLADLWKFDTEANAWTLIDAGFRKRDSDGIKYQIQPRLDMAMTSLSVTLNKGDVPEKGDVLVVHGGMNTMGHLFDDTWIFPLFI